MYCTGGQKAKCCSIIPFKMTKQKINSNFIELEVFLILVAGQIQQKVIKETPPVI
jgi:hypothetical protein